MPARRDVAPARARPDADWAGVRLHIVTGKGGTGKTTVASALAIALATGGRRVLLVEVEGRHGIAPLFDVAEQPYVERTVATAPGGGEVLALAVEPKAALLDYLELFYHLGRAGKLLERMGAVDFATTIAPGLRDVLLTGKVYEAARRRRGNAHAPDPQWIYDAVVLDAPPSGRITRFLNVNEEVVGLARVGPIRNQANSIMTLLRSPASAVHVVTLLEEMPVQETLDAVTELRGARLGLGGIVVNAVREPFLPARALGAATKGRLDREEVLAGLASAGLGGRHGTGTERLGQVADGLLAEAAGHGARVALERRERTQLAALDRPLYELPALPGGVDLGALYALAERLRAQGMA